MNSIPQKPRRRNTSEKPDPATVRRLYDNDGKSYREIADLLHSNYAAVYRAYKAASANGTPTTTLQRVDLAGEVVSPDDTALVPANRDSTADLRAQVDTLAAEVAALKAHRLEVDTWIAVFQAQSREPAQHSADLRSTTLRSLAQDSAEPELVWDDPEDAKAVPFNCSLPRGLKRLLDAEAKRTGLPASRLVQRLLTAVLVGKGGADDA